MKTYKKIFIFSALCFLIFTNSFSQIREFPDEKSINDYKMLHDLSPSIEKPFPIKPDWDLVFFDNFDDISSLENWTPKITPRGHQLCLFQDDIDNIMIKTEEKKLYITPIKENVFYINGAYKKQYYYTSGELELKLPNSTEGFLYGYFEIRCKLPRFKGAHPAFWLLSKIVEIPEEDKWDAFEIDIFEASSANPMETRRNSLSTNYSSYIFHDKINENESGKGFFINNDEPTNSLSDKFYIYALEWTPYELTYYIDDRIIRRVSTINNPLIYDMYPCKVRIGLEIDWWNPPDEGTQLEPFIIDYVRVYQKVPGIYIPKPEINGDEIVTYDWNTYWVNPHPNGTYIWEIDENGELMASKNINLVYARLKSGKTTTVLTLREEIVDPLAINPIVTNQKIITNRLPAEFRAAVNYWECDNNQFTELEVQRISCILPPNATNIINKFYLYDADILGDPLTRVYMQEGDINNTFYFSIIPHNMYIIENVISSDQYYSSSRRIIYPTLNSVFCPIVWDDIHENNPTNVWAKSMGAVTNIWDLYSCDLTGSNSSHIEHFYIPNPGGGDPRYLCYDQLSAQTSEYYYLDHITRLENSDCFPDKTRRVYFYLKDVVGRPDEELYCYQPDHKHLTKIDENICNDGFIIPNPVNNYFTINFAENNITNVNYINIFDSKGSLIKSWNKPEYNSNFDISYLKTGLYFILIVTNNQSYYEKLLKN